MPRMSPLVRASSLAGALVAVSLIVPVGCDRADADGSGEGLTRARGGDPPTGPVNPGAEPPLIVAARVGDVKRVRQLTGQGADVNAFGNGRQTALMAAAQQGHAEVVEVLVEADADANLRDAKGDTAAEAAAAHGHEALADSLRKTEVKPPKGPAKPVASPKPQPAPPKR